METAVSNPYFGVICFNLLLCIGSENTFENLHLQRCAQNKSDFRHLASKMNTAVYSAFIRVSLLQQTICFLDSQIWSQSRFGSCGAFLCLGFGSGLVLNVQNGCLCGWIDLPYIAIKPCTVIIILELPGFLIFARKCKLWICARD